MRSYDHMNNFFSSMLIVPILHTCTVTAAWLTQSIISNLFMGHFVFTTFINAITGIVYVSNVTFFTICLIGIISNLYMCCLGVYKYF